MPPDAPALRGPLLRWYRKHRRDLPWRRTRDPYAIWVSEAMLQQTTVAAVIPFWERFLRRFPDVGALARSTEEEALALWTGLGYYRRARSLRAGAIAVMERHAGRVPADRDALLDLPGVGPYTAGAIASVAFDRPEPVVDGNVKRVFSRLFAMRATGARAEARLWEIAREIVRGPDPGGLNQAVMELGATVCTPRSPRCPRCPLARRCKARAEGKPESYPAPRRRAAPREVRVHVAWIERAGKILLERGRPGGALRGTWDLPLAEGLADRTGLDLDRRETIAHVRHTILQRRLHLEVVRAAVRGRLPRDGSLRWVDPGDLDAVATSAATTKAVRAVYAASSTSSSGSRGRVRRYDFPSRRGTAPKAASSPAQ